MHRQLLNVIIIEDNEIHAAELQRILEEWGEQNKICISVRRYLCGEDFFSEKYEENELFFIDIQLTSMNGIDIAKRLRRDGFCGDIVFLTAFSEYVFEGYHVRALDYLLKPISKAKLELCMKPILKDMERAAHVYKTKTEMIKIPYNMILAFASFQHYVDIITQERATQTCYRQKITLKKLQSQLPEEFVRCHRTMIVNMNKVIRLTRKDVTLSNGSVYPVSAGYLEQVQNAFLKVLSP